MTENQSDQALVLKLMENFQFFTREVRFDVDAIKRTYSDSSITIHFLYVTKTPANDIAITSPNRSNLEMAEQSEDVFSAFKRDLPGRRAGSRTARPMPRPRSSGRWALRRTIS